MSDPTLGNSSVLVFSNSSAFSMIKFFCIADIWAMIFCRLFSAATCFFFLAASAWGSRGVAMCSTVSIATGSFFICLTSAINCKKHTFRFNISKFNITKFLQKCLNADRRVTLWNLHRIKILAIKMIVITLLLKQGISARDTYVYKN